MYTNLLSYIFLLPIRSPRFLFCLYAMIGSQGHRTGYGWYGFHRTRFFWSRLVILSFYSEYENEFGLPYDIPNLIVKLTFHIHPPLLLFDEKVERKRRSTAIFYSNIFPEVDAMQWSHTQTWYANRMFCLYICRLQSCVIIRRSCTTKTKYFNHWVTKVIICKIKQNW